MGYTTTFTGELKFTKEVTGKELALLSSILGEDCRDHPEWDARDLYYVDLQLLSDYSGIEWDGSEKTYDMDKLVLLILRLMGEKFPNFGLIGKLNAQGEEVDDRWELHVDNDGVRVISTPPSGTKIICPHCEGEFYWEQ